MKPIADYLQEKEMTVEQLAADSGLDPKMVKAIAVGNYNPSPSHRERLAAALGVMKDDIAWGHVVEVQHLYGHGPQFGRTP